jgi:hypothetical protein
MYEVWQKILFFFKPNSLTVSRPKPDKIGCETIRKEG